MENIRNEIDRIVGCNSEVTENTHNELCDELFKFVEQQLKNCNIPLVSVAQHTLPRPLECWNKARELYCGDYIEWHLEKERGNAH